MLLAFVIGLLISNFGIVLLSSVGFVGSQTREQLYVAIGAVAGLFSLFVGTIFLFGLDGTLPDPGALLPFLLTRRRGPTQLAPTVSVPFIPIWSCAAILRRCTSPARG